MLEGNRTQLREPRPTMDSASAVQNLPEHFDRFIAAPPHRLFAIFDDPAEGAEAVRVLREGDSFPHEDDIWIFVGEEGERRLDLSGSRHGIHAEIIRWFQRLMSSDVEYLRTLDEAVRGGHLVVAVALDHGDLVHVTQVLRSRGGHSLARVAHWDFVPVRA